MSGRIKVPNTVISILESRHYFILALDACGITSPNTHTHAKFQTCHLYIQTIHIHLHIHLGFSSSFSEIIYIYKAIHLVVGHVHTIWGMVSRGSLVVIWGIAPTSLDPFMVTSCLRTTQGLPHVLLACLLGKETSLHFLKL